jgi:hypothetical protein
LCRNHLLGEHRELHAIWSILTNGKKGYSRHPEVLRWQGKLKALFLRHDSLVHEMHSRGYRHLTPLPARLATGTARQKTFLHSISQQIKILKSKQCTCDL